MRILLAVHGLPPDAVGGTEIYASGLAAALHRQGGCEVAILAAEADASRPDFAMREEDRLGVRAVRINNTFRSVRAFEDGYRHPALLEPCTRLLDEFQPHVLHVQHLTRLTIDLVPEAARRRIPVIVTLQDYWTLCHRGQLVDVEHRVCDGPSPAGCARCFGLAGRASSATYRVAGLVRAVERRVPTAAGRVLRRVAAAGSPLAGGDGRGLHEAERRVAAMSSMCRFVTCFLAPSEALRRRFVEFGVDASRILPWDPGIDAAPFRAARARRAAAGAAGGERPRPLRVGFAGSLMVTKGPDVLLRAAALLPPSTVSVHLFGNVTGYHGDDRYASVLEPLLRVPGVERRPALGPTELADALASLDVLVVPSTWPENSPFVIREAFAAGVPVVASRIGGIPELVRDGENGLLFEPGNHEELALLLARLSTSASGRPRRGPEVGEGPIPAAGLPRGGGAGASEPSMAGTPSGAPDPAGNVADDVALLSRLRAGIRPVRTIDDDAADTVRLYETLAAPAGVTVVVARVPPGEKGPEYSVAAQGPVSQPSVGSPCAIRLQPDAPLPVVAEGFSPVCRPHLAAIVLNYRTPEETLLAVRALQASDRPLDELIVVDNGATGECERLLQDAAPDVTFIPVASNLGFSGGNNVGIREALRRGATRILLVNSDVVVPPDTIGKLEEALDAHPEAGIAGPVILSRADPEQVVCAGIGVSPTTGRMHHLYFGRPLEHLETWFEAQRAKAGARSGRATATEWNGSHPVDVISGCVMLIDARVFETIGLLHEAYFYSFEDLEFCLHARRAGFSSILATGAFVYHEGCQSIGAASPRRLYFATRNHLLMAKRLEQPGRPAASTARACAIVGMHVVHGLLFSEAPPVKGLPYVLLGVADHVRGRYGNRWPDRV